MEAKISCIGLNLGGDQSRDRAARVGVEIESSALALLEAKESGAGDHRCIVGRQTRSWREDGDAFPLELLSHRHRESRVAGNAAAEDQALPRKLENTTRRFLDQSIDHRILKCARDVRLVGINVFRTTHRVEYRRLEAAERERIVLLVFRQRILAQYWSREIKALRISPSRQLFDVPTARIG